MAVQVQADKSNCRQLQGTYLRDGENRRQQATFDDNWTVEGSGGNRTLGRRKLGRRTLGRRRQIGVDVRSANSHRVDVRSATLQSVYKLIISK